MPSRARWPCVGAGIGLRDLPMNVRGQGGIGAGASAKSVIESKDLTVKEAEKQLILRALEEHHGNPHARREEDRHEPAHAASKTPRLPSRRLLRSMRIQEIIHNIEVGKGVWALRTLVVLLLLVSLTVWYHVHEFQNFRAPEAMEQPNSRAISPRAKATRPNAFARSPSACFRADRDSTPAWPGRRIRI